MPRFFFGFLALFVIALGAFWRTVFFSSPQDPANVVIFFASLFILLFTFGTLVLSLIFRKKINDINFRKRFFRRFVSYAVVVASMLIGFGVLKILGAISAQNVGLLFLAAIALLLLSSH